MSEPTKETQFEQVGEVVRIFQRGSTWYANYQHNGRQYRRSLRTRSKKEARRKGLLLEAELLKGEHQQECKPAPIESLIQQYLQYLRTEERAPRTLAKYTKVFERVQTLAVRLKRRTALGIDLSFVDAYRRARAEDGCSAKTIYNETVIIRQLINFALSRRALSADPLAGLKIKKPKPTPQPCWTPAQVREILQASREPQRSAYTLLAETGMRIGELRWLTWDDVDFELNVLHVRPKPGWKPKSGDRRAIPLSPVARALLEARSRKGGWVFTAPRSPRHPQRDRQISERRLLASLKRLLKRLGLPGHLHTFRHAFISRAISEGIPEAVVRSWVGQVDPEILKLYTHIANADSQEKMRRLNATANVTSSSQEEETP